MARRRAAAKSPAKAKATTIRKKNKSLLSPLLPDSPDCPANGNGKHPPISITTPSLAFLDRSPEKKKKNNLTTPGSATPSSISGIRDLVSTRTNDIKRGLDSCQSHILKELEASKIRISKRFKTQACTQVAEEAEEEFKKISDRINENIDLVKSSYVEFINEAQVSAARVCKVSIPELAKSLDKSIENLRSRYKVQSTAM